MTTESFSSKSFLHLCKLKPSDFRKVHNNANVLFSSCRVFFLEMTEDVALERLSLRSIDPVSGERSVSFLVMLVHGSCSTKTCFQRSGTSYRCHSFNFSIALRRRDATRCDVLRDGFFFSRQFIFIMQRLASCHNARTLKLNE